MDMGLGRLWELVMDREARHAMIHGDTESDMTERLNWTDSLKIHIYTKYEAHIKKIKFLLKKRLLVLLIFFFFFSIFHLFLLWCLWFLSY